MSQHALAVQYRPAPIEAFLPWTRPAPEPEPPQGQTFTCQPLRCHPLVPLRPGLMTSSTVTRWNGLGVGTGADMGCNGGLPDRGAPRLSGSRSARW